jgi:dolichyl-phosphate-mannose-protein mannosyltransferase
MPTIAPPAAPSKSPDLSPVVFWLGIIGVFVVSLALRFWGLSRFNGLVFDEVYYARFAGHFLKQELIFTGHPPLSTYIVAIGIWLGEQLPWSAEGAKNGLSGLYLSPFSYRWLNALSGSFIPLLVSGIAYQLSHRRSYALIAAILMAADGLYLVESRYALNNIYLVIFGLLGNIWFLLALRSLSWQRWLWLGLAGVGFGASASIKWNGLGFLLGAYGVWIAGWVLHWIGTFRHRSHRSPQARSSPAQSSPAQSSPARSSPARSPLHRFPLQNLTQIHLGHILVCFALIPALTYYVSWLPYAQLSADSIWDLQIQTLDYHQRVGGLEAHPYCSLWYTWPLMLRPIAYFYQTTHGINEPVPVIGPPTPPSASAVIYDVHAMGNPFLWWFSTAAIGLFVAAFAYYLWRWFTASTVARSANLSVINPSVVNPAAIHPANRSTTFTPYGWLTLYLLINWSANLLPWARVTRCVFIYHYMVSLIFAVLALAFLVDRWVFHPRRTYQIVGISIIVIVLLALVFWLPFYLGLPLSPSGLDLRRWLDSWI